MGELARSIPSLPEVAIIIHVVYKSSDLPDEAVFPSLQCWKSLFDSMDSREPSLNNIGRSSLSIIQSPFAVTNKPQVVLLVFSLRGCG